MKKKTFTTSQIICILLVAALVLSVVALICAESKNTDLKEDDQALQTQPEDIPIQEEVLPAESYCTLVIDTWSAKDGILTIGTFAQAVLSENVGASARLEFWKDEAVLSSQPITLEPGEAAGVYEADVTAQFEIPEITTADDLQLWLVVELENGQVLDSCGAGWYLEDEQLMLITG